MKVGDLVKCDDWVFDGTTGIVVKILHSGPSKIKDYPPSGVQILTPGGYFRVSIHNIKVINETR